MCFRCNFSAALSLFWINGIHGGQAACSYGEGGMWLKILSGVEWSLKYYITHETCSLIKSTALQPQVRYVIIICSHMIVQYSTFCMWLGSGFKGNWQESCILVICWKKQNCGNRKKGIKQSCVKPMLKAINFFIIN